MSISIHTSVSAIHHLWNTDVAFRKYTRSSLRFLRGSFYDRKWNPCRETFIPQNVDFTVNALTYAIACRYLLEAESNKIHLHAKLNWETMATLEMV